MIHTVKSPSEADTVRTLVPGGLISKMVVEYEGLLNTGCRWLRSTVTYTVSVSESRGVPLSWARMVN